LVDLLVVHAQKKLKGGVKMKNVRISTKFFFFILFGFLLYSPIYSEAKTYTVSNVNDSGAGSLRAAIDSANNHAGRDTIEFYISGTGVKTISPLTQLPNLMDPSGVFINGLTQSGASMGVNPPATLTLKVEINGANAGNCYGIFVDCDNNRIQGLIINNFALDGISVEAGPVLNTSNNEICWNIIGLDSIGSMPIGNCYNPTGLWAGVRIYNVPADGGTSVATDNHIEENLISGNSPFGDGVQIVGPQVPGDVFGNFVERNFIGTDINGMMDLGNAHEGVCLCEGTHDNLVGTNLISGNDYDGVGMQGFNNVPFPPAPPIQTHDNIVTNNIIGLAIDVITPLSNSLHGVAIGEYGPTQWGCADFNTIGPGNIIAYNGGAGVSVWEDGVNAFNADGNMITQNSIYENVSLGIDLQNNGVTLNDIGDMDAGPNEELNFPVIDSAFVDTEQINVYGHINIDTDPTQAIVEVFQAKTDPSGYGEGQVYLGTSTPDASGNWIIIIPGSFVVGDTLTATTTDMNFNTSEFSLNRVVTASAGIPDVKKKDVNLLKVSSPFLVNSIEINYEVKKEEKIRLAIYDLSGKLITNLVDKVCAPSSCSVSWDGKNTIGESVPAGIYICSLESAGSKVAKKILKIK
jgi:hypothetical protein